MTEQVKETSPIVEECSCDKVEAPKVEAQPKIEAPVVDFTPITTSLSGLAEKLASLEAKIGVRENPTIPAPTAQVATSNTSEISLGKMWEKMQESFADGRDFVLTLPYDQIRSFGVKSNGIKEAYRNYQEKVKIKEAYTLSGTHSVADLSTSVQTVPGGIDQAPIRAYTEYVSIPKGRNAHTFFTAGVPSAISQTAGTTATESSLTITSKTVTPSTISGVYFKINTDDEENVPYGLANVIVEQASKVVVDFENDDILNVVSAEGTLTPGKWLKGSDGSVITTSDYASVTLDPSAIGKASAYLRAQGYMTGGVKPVLAVHPSALDQLIRDSDITNFTQFGDPSITANGAIPSLYGVDIVPTTSVEAKTNTTNNAWNALMFVPGMSYGSASKRDVTLKFHEVAEDNQIRVNMSWRFKSVVKDANSVVRISTTQV